MFSKNHIWVLNLSFLVAKNASSEFWCWKAKPVSGCFFLLLLLTSYLILILCFRKAGVIHRDAFKLSLSFDYTFEGFWSELVRHWAKLGIKGYNSFAVWETEKWSIFEYFIIEYIHHPVVFIKHPPVHGNVSGTKITGKNVSDLEPETMVAFVLTGQWTQMLNCECSS